MAILFKQLSEILWGLPRELMGETGVWKKITEDTMTTIRFTQFPTEWVTGDTICRIEYET